MTTDTIESPEEVGALISAALPKGWYTSTLMAVRALDEREPGFVYEIEFRWGTVIEGGRTVHYVGGTGTQETGRTVTVRARGANGADLASIAALLPNLEALGALRWPIEFDITGWTEP